jgi:hypothetical protein
MEKIPRENTQERSDPEYELVKTEFEKSLDEPAYEYVESTAETDPNELALEERVTEYARSVKLYFSEGATEKVVTLIQEYEMGQEDVPSTAEQILSAIQREGGEPSVIEYEIRSHEGVYDTFLEKYTDTSNEYVSAFIPFEEVKETIVQSIESQDKKENS